MRNNDVITVDGLKKIYDIYDNPADRLKEIFSLRRKKYSSQFTALSDINFSIEQGEFIGIVGRNGAGKSTLLKILSGQLTPTSGTVKVDGTISLLQLGVGFNKELSGIDNIRFTSRLLGHKTAKIDEIVNEAIEFADIGEFIHHPVKTYSSGMYSRLAFAIGITTNPDILIVDEVLSVGDMQFASKCLSKMHDLKKSGKTVIIVTHDVEKVAVFCDRAIWLKDTRIEAIGTARDVIEQYRDYMWMGKKAEQTAEFKPSKKITDKKETNNLHTENQDFLTREIEWHDLSGFATIQNDTAIITHAAVYNSNSDKTSSTFERGDSVLIYLKITSSVDISDISPGWVLTDKKGLVAIHSGSNFFHKKIEHIKNNKDVLCCFEFIMPPLRNSEYIFSFGLRKGDSIIFKVNNVFPIQIIGDDINSQQGGYVILEKSNFYC